MSSHLSVYFTTRFMLRKTRIKLEIVSQKYLIAKNYMRSIKYRPH
jgi:hypothetical protein